MSISYSFFPHRSESDDVELGLYAHKCLYHCLKFSSVYFRMSFAICDVAFLKLRFGVAHKSPAKRKLIPWSAIIQCEWTSSGVEIGPGGFWVFKVLHVIPWKSQEVPWDVKNIYPGTAHKGPAHGQAWFNVSPSLMPRDPLTFVSLFGCIFMYNAYLDC